VSAKRRNLPAVVGSAAPGKAPAVHGAFVVPAVIAGAGERAGMRFFEFFVASIRNPHTRRAHARAADEFLAWCAAAMTMAQRRDY
jgi:hypothetical protein